VNKIVLIQKVNRKVTPYVRSVKNAAESKRRVEDRSSGHSVGVNLVCGWEEGTPDR